MSPAKSKNRVFVIGVGMTKVLFIPLKHSEIYIVIVVRMTDLTLCNTSGQQILLTPGRSSAFSMSKDGIVFF